MQTVYCVLQVIFKVKLDKHFFKKYINIEFGNINIFHLCCKPLEISSWLFKIKDEVNYRLVKVDKLSITQQMLNLIRVLIQVHK